MYEIPGEQHDEDQNDKEKSQDISLDSIGLRCGMAYALLNNEVEQFICFLLIDHCLIEQKPA